ncbi:stAR-related lipid transfer protein 6 [Xenopus laevis]|uniref:StAR-related lipid transfer protein 6 n=1 Tax=Xenopus laevis TaxID=8355 RepID=A0A8J1M276_XENLA|nr:stAR-related lipid transfer protein 6 [Xenopus laevis]
MDYQKIAADVAQKILLYSQDTTGWKVSKSSKNIVVSWKPSKEYSGNIAHIGHHVIYFIPRNPAHSKLSVFIQPELGGLLPRSLVESALPNNVFNLIKDTREGLKQL